jgi:hypothetical protein
MGFLSLYQPEDLDARFGKAIEETLPGVREKVQLVIQLTGSLLYTWMG